MKPFDFQPISKKEKTLKYEKKLAKELKGIPQPASGAIAGFKGDIRTTDLLVDSKQTVMSSFRLSLTDLHKITKEARGVNKFPCILITFEETTRVMPGKWAVIPIEVLTELIDKKGE